MFYTYKPIKMCTWTQKNDKLTQSNELYSDERANDSSYTDLYLAGHS